MSEELVCITCPMGCRLKVDRLADGALSVSGNRCPRGEKYANEEFLAPKRTVTATCRIVGTEGAPVQRIPVRTREPFPKDGIAALLEDIYRIELRLPVKRGDVVLSNAEGSGVDVIVTRTVG
jgi:CxxC motif-containing protein